MSDAAFQNHVVELGNYAAIVVIAALIAFIVHIMLSD